MPDLVGAMCQFRLGPSSGPVFLPCPRSNDRRCLLCGVDRHAALDDALSGPLAAAPKKQGHTATPPHRPLISHHELLPELVCRPAAASAGLRKPDCGSYRSAPADAVLDAHGQELVEPGGTGPPDARHHYEALRIDITSARNIVPSCRANRSPPPRAPDPSRVVAARAVHRQQVQPELLHGDRVAYTPPCSSCSRSCSTRAGAPDESTRRSLRAAVRGRAREAPLRQRSGRPVFEDRR